MLVVGQTLSELILPSLSGTLINRQSIKQNFYFLNFRPPGAPSVGNKIRLCLRLIMCIKTKALKFSVFLLIEIQINWEKAILVDDINWIHVVDSLGATSERFFVNVIAFNLLLNESGVIVDFNIKVRLF